MTDDCDPQLRQKLEDAVAALPRIQRDIFLAHSVDGLTYAEIALAFGLTERKVERHFAKAIYTLCRRMDGRSLKWCERWF
ncbi:MAG: sigma-70 region 4 domain-containing protein [Pseudomonadota bacterium]